MDNKDTINELLGIEAMSQLLLEKSRKLRLKLAGDSSSASKKKKQLDEERKAAIGNYVRTQRRKAILRMCNKQ